MFDKNLISLELQNGKSLRELCTEYNWIYSRIYYWCKRNNIALSYKQNGKSKSTLCARKGARIFSEKDYKKLKNLYIDKNLSVKNIAIKLNTTGATIAATLRRLNIPVKLKNGRYVKVTPQYERKVLEELYVNKKLSTHKISKLLNYPHHGKAVEDLKYYNIPRRSYKEAGKISYEHHPEKKQLHREHWYAGVTGPKNINVSSLEQKFMGWAAANNIEIVHQFQIRKNWHRYDFLIKNTNIIVEMDGDFWHSLQTHIERDKQFDLTAERHNFDVVRLREKDVNLNANIFNDVLLPAIERSKLVCKKETEQ